MTDNDTALNTSLYPCPFCHGELVYVESDGEKFHYVECQNCGARGPAGFTAKGALRRYNYVAEFVAKRGKVPA